MEKKKLVIRLIVISILILYGIGNLFAYVLARGNSVVNRPGIEKEPWLWMGRRNLSVGGNLAFLYLVATILAIIFKRTLFPFLLVGLYQLYYFVLFLRKGFPIWQDIIVPLLIGVAFFFTHPKVKEQFR